MTHSYAFLLQHLIHTTECFVSSFVFWHKIGDKHANWLYCLCQIEDDVSVAMRVCNGVRVFSLSFQLDFVKCQMFIFRGLECVRLITHSMDEIIFRLILNILLCFCFNICEKKILEKCICNEKDFFFPFLCLLFFYFFPFFISFSLQFLDHYLSKMK